MAADETPLENGLGGKAMDAKKMIVRIAQRMDEKNLTNAFEGNVSVMEGGLLYITPSGTQPIILGEEGEQAKKIKNVYIYCQHVVRLK